MNQRCLIAGFWNAFWLLSFTWFEYLHLHSVSIYFADFYFAAYFNLLYKFNFYGFCVLPLILCSKECTFYYPFSYKTCFLTPTIAQVGKNVSCVNSTILLVFYHPSHLFTFFSLFSCDFAQLVFLNHTDCNILQLRFSHKNETFRGPLWPDHIKL